MYFRVLGPVDVLAEERSHSIGPWKEQIVLAILLLESGRVVSAQTLAERVWDEQVPTHARGTLQAYISRLRSRLRTAGDRVGLITSSAAGGYRLNVGPDQVDVRQFNQLISSARAAAAAKDPHAARSLLIRAEDLWRGEPLEGLTGQWAESARQALLERRRGALLARLGFDLQLETDRTDAISELAEFTSAGRIDENAIAMLMSALADAGRKEEALAAFRSARTRLREQLGVDPRRELRALHQRILSDEPLPAAPNAAPTRHGALAPNTLDRDPPYLIGRDENVHDLLASIATDLEAPTAVSLCCVDGMPGVGKTAVVLRAAHKLLAQCPDGALQINFRTHDPRQAPLDSRAALVLLLEALGTGSDELGHAGSLDELVSLWRRRTYGLRLLVLFDDVSDADQIAPLIPVARDSIVLVTSRRRLSHLPGARHRTLAALNDVAAIRLLTRVSGRRFPNQVRELQRFAARCAGLPLAVAVAGAHLRAHPTWTLTDLVDRLESSRPATEHDQLSGPVHRAFELSYRTLPEPQRRLLRLIASQPVPDISVHAAAALVDGELRETDLNLEALVEHHLLEEISRHRYRLHDLLRDFATRQAAAEDEEHEINAAVDRVIAFYIAAAADAERSVRPTRRVAARIPTYPRAAQPGLDKPAAAQAWLDDESANLLSIAAITDAAPGHPHAGVMACIVAHYLDRRGLWPQAVEVLIRALHATVGPGDLDPTLAQLHIHLAAAHVRLRRLDDAADYANSALEAWRGLNDQRGQADALLELGRIHWYAQRLDPANAAYNASAARYRQLGHPAGQISADYHRAIILFQQGRRTDAISVARRALVMVGEADDSALECDVLVNLAEMYRLTRQNHLARNCLERAERLAQPHRDPQILAALALNNGILHHRAEEHASASDSLRVALEHFRSLGDRDNQIDTLVALAAVERSQRDLANARDGLHEAELLLADADDPERRSRIETEIGMLLGLERNEPEAYTHLHKAVQLAQRAGASLEEADARSALADCLYRLGDPTRGREEQHRAMVIFESLGLTGAAQHPAGQLNSDLR